MIRTEDSLLRCVCSVLRMLRLKHTLMKNGIMNTGLSSLKDASPEKRAASLSLEVNPLTSPDVIFN